MWHIGLDVHARQWTYVVLDENGKKRMTRSGRGAWSKLLQELTEIKHPFAICFEASTGYGYLYDELRKTAQRVSVAHPGHLRLIFRSKKKNDRVDAGKLAKLLFLDEVPPVYVPSIDVRSWRRMIEYRHGLVGERTRLKNRLRALLRTRGIVAPKGLWSKAGVAWLKGLDLETDFDDLQRDILVDELETFNQRIVRVETPLNATARRHPGVQLLMTIPGVGLRTAEAVMAYVDDPERFSEASKLSSYFGLVPSQDQSASINRLGRITREGPRTVRKLVVEAAWQGIRRSKRIRAYYERMRHGDPERKKIAIVATAHYLVRVMHAMLRTGEVWRSQTTQALDPEQETAA